MNILLRNVSVFGQLVEHVTLVYGIFQFHIYVQKNCVKRIGKKMCPCNTNHFKYWKKKMKIPCLCCICSEKGTACVLGLHYLIIAILLFVLYIPMSFVPPILFYCWNEEIHWISKDSDDEIKYLSKVYAGLTSVAFISNLFVRIAMIIITSIVSNTWTERLNKISDQTNGAQYLLDQYKTTGQFVAALQGIFQTWFIIKWIIYFIDITSDSLIAINSIFGNSGQIRLKIVIHIVVHLIYNFSAFMTLYVCGNLMNWYNNKYCRKLKKKLKKSKEDKLTILIELSSLKNPKYLFIPSLCGLNIPLDNPGYTLSMVIALFAFIANFIHLN